MTELLNAYGGPIKGGYEKPDLSVPMASKLPKPATYHMLCAVPDVDEEFESGILKADQTQYADSMLTPVLFVIELGPDAFKDPKRFPSGPSCKKGDFVMVRPNSGTRFKIAGREFRILADDSVEAVVEDPRLIKRCTL